MSFELDEIIEAENQAVFEFIRSHGAKRKPRPPYWRGCIPEKGIILIEGAIVEGTFPTAPGGWTDFQETHPV